MVTAVAGDGAGNVYATIDVWPVGAQQASDTRTEVWRFDATGTKAWSLSLPSGTWGGHELAALPSGDVAVAVCSAPGCYSPDGSALVSAVLRVAASDGHVVWRAPMPGSAFGSLSADASGRLLAMSTTTAADGTGAHAVLVADGGGILLDQPTDLRFAKGAIGGVSGDLVVAGQDASGKPAFERRRSGGSLVLRSVLDTPRGQIDRVAFAPNGSIALGGWADAPLTIGTEAYAGFFTSGFLAVASGDGTPQWSKLDAAFMSSASGVPPVLGFGRDNDVVAFTMTFGKGRANLRSYTRDGALKWSHDFRGIYGTWVNRVGVADTGDVVVGAHGTADAPFQALTFPAETNYVAVIAR